MINDYIILQSHLIIIIFFYIMHDLKKKVSPPLPSPRKPSIQTHL